MKNIPFERSFASHIKSKNWSNKNQIKPSDVTISNGNKYIFDCDKCGHSFEMTPAHIVHNNNWCPFCSGHKICERIDCNMCFNKSFASHEKSKYWSDKNTKIPIQVHKNSNNKYKFDCEKCKHIFQITLSDISGYKNAWCGFCANKILCENDNCDVCFNKSFASHEKSKYWSCRNSQTPRQLFKSDNKKYFFDCDCKHLFDIPLNSIIQQESWCSYCSNPPKKLCDNDNCQECFNKSFASHLRSKYWSSKNTLFKYIFNCDNCKHVFETSLSGITFRNSWCIYCVNQKLCQNNNCNICFDKSFASNIKSKFWSDENIKNPRQVFKSSNIKYIFYCENNHQFVTIPNHITQKSSWCPFCLHKTEMKLLKWLENNYTNIEAQVRFEWSKINKSQKIYDFCLPKHNLLIELDGKQHFEQVSNWKSPELTQINDFLKNDLALDNGYNMIRICQQIVFDDKEDWENKLKDTIKNLTDNPQIHTIGSIYNS